MTSEVCGAARIQQRTSKLIRRGFTVQTDPKQTAKATKEFLNRQISHLARTQQSMLHQILEVAAVKARQSNSSEEMECLVMSRYDPNILNDLYLVILHISNT